MATGPAFLRLPIKIVRYGDPAPGAVDLISMPSDHPFRATKDWPASLPRGAVSSWSRVRLTMTKRLWLGLLASFGLLAAGCGETRRVEPVASTGFLGPDIFARLQPSEDGAQVYGDPAVNFRLYRRVQIAPVRVLIPAGGTPLTLEQRSIVATAVQDALRAELGRNFEIATQPGPGTILVSAAISEVREGGNPVLSAASSFMPLARLAREGVAVVAGSDPLVGGAAGEMKLTDAMTGRLLAAGIDARGATAGIRIRGSSLDDVVFVAQYWARLTALRLCRLQQRPTRAALAAAKARGKALGGDRGYRPAAGPEAAAVARARREEAERAAHRLGLELDRLRADGVAGHAALARALNERGVTTPTGSGTWTHTTVARIVGRMGQTALVASKQ